MPRLSRIVILLFVFVMGCGTLITFQEQKRGNNKIYLGPYSGTALDFRIAFEGIPKAVCHEPLLLGLVPLWYPQLLADIPLSYTADTARIIFAPGSFP